VNVFSPGLFFVGEFFIIASISLGIGLVRSFMSTCTIVIIIIAIISLGLDSAYEGKFAIFVLPGLTYVIQHDELLFHPFSCK
jgi:hypothetical protein